jgi:hypothetical protein
MLALINSQLRENRDIESAMTNPGGDKSAARKERPALFDIRLQDALRLYLNET